MNLNSWPSTFFTKWARRLGGLPHPLPLLALALVLATNPELRAWNAVPFASVADRDTIFIAEYSAQAHRRLIPGSPTQHPF